VTQPPSTCLQQSGRIGRVNYTPHASLLSVSVTAAGLRTRCTGDGQRVVGSATSRHQPRDEGTACGSAPTRRRRSCYHARLIPGAAAHLLFINHAVSTCSRSPSRRLLRGAASHVSESAARLLLLVQLRVCSEVVPFPTATMQEAALQHVAGGCWLRSSCAPRVLLRCWSDLLRCWSELGAMHCVFQWLGASSAYC
jgi:hypothetical protein